MSRILYTAGEWRAALRRMPSFQERPGRDPLRIRYGCFLPDLTGLASAASATGIGSIRARTAMFNTGRNDGHFFVGHLPCSGFCVCRNCDGKHGDGGPNGERLCRTARAICHRTLLRLSTRKRLPPGGLRRSVQRETRSNIARACGCVRHRKPANCFGNGDGTPTRCCVALCEHERAAAGGSHLFALHLGRGFASTTTGRCCTNTARIIARAFEDTCAPKGRVPSRGPLGFEGKIDPKPPG